MAIHILPPELASQIAAGEVVERPASAVKELLDNAIDAGAKTVRIDIEKGGSRKILVVDDGKGMDRDDAVLSVERHTTSKIRTLEDLSAIRTLGFRGEALASIASVGRMALRTRTKDSLSGWMVKVDAGKDKVVEEIGAPIGTSVLVEDLFYNVPARRKFLKAESTEFRHINDVTLQHALGHEDVHYVLRHNNRTVLDLQAVPDRFDRVATILGKSTAEDLVAVLGETAMTSVEGFASRPRYYRKTADQVYFILNGRAIQSRLLMSAVLGGYEKCLPPRHYPAVVLYVTIDPHDVDVNVHPSKIEVKFVNDGRVFSLVRAAVHAAISESPAGLPPKREEAPKTESVPDEEFAPRIEEKRRRASQQTLLPRPPSIPVGDYRDRVKEKVAEFLGKEKPLREPHLPTRPPKIESEEEETPPEEEPTPVVVPQRTLPTSALPDDLKPLGQALGTYILCRSTNGLVIIDVHAAHERIRYEELKAESARSSPSSEHLLFPFRAEMSPSDVSTLMEHRDKLSRIGFEYEDFGGGTLSVSRIPTTLELNTIEPILRDLSTDLRERKDTASWDETSEEILIRISCHSALRSGASLGAGDMELLIEQLRATPRGDTCPHGRPTWIMVKKGDLERLFKRSGF